jgi:hypothetical protein
VEHQRWQNLALSLLLSTSACLGCGAGTDAANQMAACDAAMRFVVKDPGNGSRYGGSGQVLDLQTGLVWMRYPYYPSQTGQNQTQAMSYCSSLGMRLPTKEEATDIGMHEATCAWPTNWSTWTSTISGGQAWIAFSNGSSIMADPSTGIWGDGSDGGDVLCVR